MSTFAIIMVSVFGVCAAFFTIAAIINYVSMRRFVREGLTTDGTVTKVEDDDVNGGWTNHVAYRVEGRPYTLKTGIGRWVVGEKATIRYLARDPERANVDTNRWFQVVVALGAAGLFWVVVAVFLILSRAGVL